jgi:hypothetical protein
MGTFRTITLKGNPVIVNDRFAAGAIKPGHVIELDTNGKWQAHATAGGAAVAPSVALESEFFGKGIDTDYAEGDPVRAGYFKPGEEVALWLYNNETAVIGSNLESQGDGTVRVVDTDASFRDVKVGSIRFKSLEAASPTTGNVRIKALVI